MCPDAPPGRPEVRGAGPDDGPFLRHLFTATRPEFGALPADLAATIAAQQYELRERQYRARHPALVDHIVEVGGRPVGRLTIASVADGAVIVVVDVAVLPEEQRRGIGSAVLAGLIARADEQGAAIELSVLAENPAVRLYERLGFAASAHEENVLYLRMHRHPT